MISEDRGPVTPVEEVERQYPSLLDGVTDESWFLESRREDKVHTHKPPPPTKVEQSVSCV